MGYVSTRFNPQSPTEDDGAVAAAPAACRRASAMAATLHAERSAMM
jgi:hypothetical protein